MNTQNPHQMKVSNLFWTQDCSMTHGLTFYQNMKYVAFHFEAEENKYILVPAVC